MTLNERRDDERNKASRNWIGVILVIAGVLLLSHKIGAPIPYWIFSWPMLLILIGVLAGIKSGFQNAGAFVLIIVGSVFLVDRIVPELNFDNYIFPALLIGVGLIYLLRPRHNWGNMSGRPLGESSCKNSYTKSKIIPDKRIPDIKDYPAASVSPTGGANDTEYVNINAVFGGVKKIILSKNFQGGEINSIMGGTELNLLQADLQRPAILVVNNFFGGTKLVVPSNWDIKNEMTAFFGGIEDKRSLNMGMPDAGKILILKGGCVFGGIEVSNY